MMDPFTPYFVFLAALGSGLIAGLFFAFSAFIMSALVKLPVEQGIAAMQSINISVVNRLFLTVFMGTTSVSILLMVISLFHWESPNAIYLLGGGLFYFFGSFMVTIVCNVPLNDSLASVNANHSGSITLWNDYISKWTAWNHVRTLTSLLAMASFVLAFGV